MRKSDFIYTIPDVMKVGGENLFIYRNKDEFIREIKRIMDDPRAYRIDVRKYSWQSKAREFEVFLKNIIRGKKADESHLN